MNFKLSTVVFIDFYHNFVLWLYRFEILKQIDVVFDSQKLWPFWYWYFVASFAMLNSSNNKRICFDIFPMYKKFNKFTRFNLTFHPFLICCQFIQTVRISFWHC